METVVIQIGFDDHVSSYQVPVDMLRDLSNYDTSSDAKDMIVNSDRTELVESTEGDLFLVADLDDNIIDFRMDVSEHLTGIR